MLSFGTGNQRMIADQFDELGLFTMMLVFPGEAESDSSVLDYEAVEHLAEIPGVRLAYPYDRFDVSVKSASTDSVLENLLSDPDGSLRARLTAVEVDSLFGDVYLDHILRRELDAGPRRFIDGYLNAQVLITDTLTVRGVTSVGSSWLSRVLSACSVRREASCSAGRSRRASRVDPVEALRQD